MKKYFIIIASLILSIQIISCSKFRKYEGTYQTTDYMGIKDKFIIDIKEDSIIIGETNYFHKKSERGTVKFQKRINSNHFPYKLIGDTVVVQSGDTLTFRLPGNGLLITELKMNDTIHQQFFNKKRKNFRVRVGNAFVRF